MAKLPEDQRPPMETLERFLNVSADRRAKFMIDLQNDCACGFEPYDAATDWQPYGLVYWNEGRPHVAKHRRLALPIQPGVLTDAIVDELVAYAGMNDETFELYDMLTYGVITCNLGGWGILCHSVRKPV